MRAKGVVDTKEGKLLFQYASGVYDIRPTKPTQQRLVFLGDLDLLTKTLIARLVAKAYNKNQAAIAIKHAKQIIR